VDYASRIDIYNAMNDLVANGASILFISSEFEEILGMSDRILVLADGRIVCDLLREETNKELLMQFATGSN
jgi:ribose transport system ATP-binding protein